MIKKWQNVYMGNERLVAQCDEQAGYVWVRNPCSDQRGLIVSISMLSLEMPFYVAGKTYTAPTAPPGASHMYEVTNVFRRHGHLYAQADYWITGNGEEKIVVILTEADWEHHNA